MLFVNGIPLVEVECKSPGIQEPIEAASRLRQTQGSHRLPPPRTVVQNSEEGEASRIIETKGLVWEGTAAKDGALCLWWERMSAETGTRWR